MNSFVSLAGKVAVITGGAGVLGLALGKGLARCGVKIAILGRSVKGIEAAKVEIETLGGSAMALVADVLDEGSLRQSAQQVLEQWGHIDVLINCAGGNLPGATISPEQTIFDLSVADFDEVMTLNSKGSLLPILVFGAAMKEARGGSIINISSMSAQQPLTRVFGYSASKAAVDNMTRWLAVEMAKKFGGSIRVNAIAPGFFVGAQNRRLLLQDDGQLTARGQTIIDHTPMGRFGEPEELCGVVNWLCSDEASFVTGVIIPIDGGFSAFQEYKNGTSC
ncbi:MAG: SDR family oxidoreductase [Lewinella sp.]|nr:SDR family oxidoreductase [Lewinella sp.]